MKLNVEEFKKIINSRFQRRFRKEKIWELYSLYLDNYDDWIKKIRDREQIFNLIYQNLKKYEEHKNEKTIIELIKLKAWFDRLEDAIYNIETFTNWKFKS